MDTLEPPKKLDEGLNKKTIKSLIKKFEQSLEEVNRELSNSNTQVTENSGADVKLLGEILSDRKDDLITFIKILNRLLEESK
jgi:5'-3' exonuclease